MRSAKNYHLFVLALVIIIYLWLRFWNLSEACLFFDEIFSLHAARQSWGSMLWFVAQDLIHPPLFYILLKIWTGIGGDGLFWVRLFPLIFFRPGFGPVLSIEPGTKIKRLADRSSLSVFGCQRLFDQIRAGDPDVQRGVLLRTFFRFGPDAAPLLSRLGRLCRFCRVVAQPGRVLTK